MFFYKEQKRAQRTFRSFLKNGKERKERSVLLKRMEKKAKNAAFFYKERKERRIFFIKNRKERMPNPAFPITVC